MAPCNDYEDELSVCQIGGDSDWLAGQIVASLPSASARLSRPIASEVWQ